MNDFNFTPLVPSRLHSVREATTKMGHHLDRPLNRTDLAYRLSVVVEEMREMMIAAQRLSDVLYQKRGPETIKQASTDFLKEMVDLSYTLDGTAATFGWDFDRAFELVHESNMTKSPSAGPFEKWIKGADYKEADVSSCLASSIPIAE